MFHVDPILEGASRKVNKGAVVFHTTLEILDGTHDISHKPRI